MVKIDAFVHVLLPAVNALIFFSSGAMSVESRSALFDRKKSCARAYAPKTVNGTLLACWYLCKGLPVRFDFEENGSTCFMDSWDIGKCDNSKCLEIMPTTVASSIRRTARTKKSFPHDQGQVSLSPGIRKHKCTRAAKRIEAVRRSCRYRCLGQPMRLEMEPDGTPCKPAPRRRGYCYEGRCRTKYPKTKPPHGPGTSTTGQDHFVPHLNCSKKKRKRTPDGAVTACFFRCGRGKSRFMVMEENFTPCVDSRGSRGVCIGKVCRTPLSVTTPSTASRKTSMAQKRRRTSTPVLLSRETYVADNSESPSSDVSVTTNGITSVRTINHFTAGCSPVLGVGSRDHPGGCSETSATLSTISPETTATAYTSVAVKIPTRTARNAGSQVLVNVTEANISSEDLFSESNSGHGVSAKNVTPEITSGYADGSTMASVMKATSAERAVESQVKITSVTSSVYSTGLKESDESLKYVIGTTLTTRESVTNWNIEDVRSTQPPANLGSPERASEKLVRSAVSEGNVTTSMVHASSHMGLATSPESSSAPDSLKLVNKQTTSAYLQHVVTTGSHRDVARKQTTESLSMNTTPTYQQFTRAGEHELSSEIINAGNAINLKASNGTSVTVPPNIALTPEERSEGSPQNLQHSYSLVESEAKTPFLVPTSTGAFPENVFAHEHQSVTRYPTVSPLAGGKSFHKISTAPVDSTRRMGSFIFAPERTTQVEHHEPVGSDTKSPMTYTFVTPSVQTAEEDENQLASSPLLSSTREPPIIFTDFFQKFATRSLIRRTTPLSQNNARLFAPRTAIQKIP